MKKKAIGMALTALIVLSFMVAPATASKKGIPAPGAKHNVIVLSPADPAWGAPIEGSSGWVKCFKTANTFKGVIQLRGLEPNHEYTLCINGKPGMPGNATEYHDAGVSFYDYDANTPRWTTPGGAWGAEEFCDFVLIKTDNKGNYGGSFSKELPAGEYDVKFFIKDAHAWCIYEQTHTWKTIVLYNNDLSFDVLG